MPLPLFQVTRMTALLPLTIMITGATDGLGRQVALNLACQGHCVLAHGRNPDKGAALLLELQNGGAHPATRYFNADLASLSAVKALAAEVLASQTTLNVLVNNAGIGPRAPGSPRQLNAEGIELMFAVNYLAGYTLSRALLPLLKSSIPARIVNVASIGQQPLDFEDVMMSDDYDDARAYRQSKLAQILDTFTLAEQIRDTGVTVNCLHPATLMNTRMVYDSAYFPASMTTIDQGAAAVENLISSPALEQVSGAYFDGQQEARANDQAYDQQARMKLLTLSAALTGY